VILDWFDTTKVTQFASSIAAQYGRLRKSTALRMDDASKRAKKVEKLVQKVREFDRDERLNIYKKARMMKEIGNGLRQQGVPAAEVTAFVDSLLLTDLPRR
jgi:hypothetical protein